MHQELEASIHSDWIRFYCFQGMEDGAHTHCLLVSLAALFDISVGRERETETQSRSVDHYYYFSLIGGSIVAVGYERLLYLTAD